MKNENLILQIKDLHFQYPSGDFKMKVSDIQITKGSKIAISGKSGSGKTTLINQLVIIAYFLGVSPKRLGEWYRSHMK